MVPAPHPVSVLHVDDDPHFLELAATALDRVMDDISVTSVTSPADGLAHLYDDGTAVDCVVSDYEMPRMDGLEFLVAVRSEFPDLPFVLLTGKGHEEIASRAISAGVTDYVQKQPGIDQFADLANRIESYVERPGARSQLESVERELALWKEFSPAVIMVDPEGRLTSASATCRGLFGVDALDELVGVDVETLVHPDERDDVADVMREARRERTSKLCRDRTIVSFDGGSFQTTVQWRPIDHWGQESLLAVVNDFSPDATEVSTAP